LQPELGRPLRFLAGLVVVGGLLCVPRAVAAANTYYVATTGSDANAGTMAAPFASWAKAQSVVSAGDTVYFRAGRYRFTDATATCGGSTSATVNAVVLNKSGTSGNPINYFAYPGERPVFDFSGITDAAKYNCRQAGVRVEASWLHLKGLELTGTLQLNNLNHESWCVYVYGGSNNVFNRMVLPAPALGNFSSAPTKFTTGANAGLYSGGFGTIVPTNGTSGQRSGTFVARLQF